MKKQLLIITLAFILLAAPVAAKSNENANNNGSIHSNETNSNGNGKSEEAKENHGPAVLGQDDENIPPTTTPSVSPSPTVVREDQELNENDDAAARETLCDPDGEWKNHGEYVSCVAHLHLGGQTVSQAAHSDIGKKDHDEDPTPSPITSAQSTLGQGISPLSTLGSLISSVIGFLQNLI